jgi:hypothetical protein
MRIKQIFKRSLLHSLTLMPCLLGSSMLFADAAPDLSEPAITAAINAAVQEEKVQHQPPALTPPVTANSAVPPEDAPSVIPPDDDSAPITTPVADEQPTVVNEQPATAIPPSTRLWNLQDADILSVINEVSQETGKNFVVDPRVTGKISLVSSKPLRKGEVYNVFLSVLELLGYSAVPSGSVVKIVPNMESGEMATRVASRQSPGQGDEVVVRVIPLNNVTATQLIPVLRPMMPQWSNISVTFLFCWAVRKI